MLSGQVLVSELVESAVLKKRRRAIGSRHPWTFLHARLIAHYPTIGRFVPGLLPFWLCLCNCLLPIRVVSHFPRVVRIGRCVASLYSIVQLLRRQASMLDPQLTFVLLLYILVMLHEVEKQLLVKLGVRLRPWPIMHEIRGAPDSTLPRQSTQLLLVMCQLPIFVLNLLYQVNPHRCLLFLCLLAQILLLLELGLEVLFVLSS